MVADTLSIKEANVVEKGMDTDEKTLMAMDAASSSYLDQNRKNNANYNYNVYLTSCASNSETCMYDWLVDSRSTNHIACQCNFFSSYKPTLDVTVNGIDGKTIQVEECSIVSLVAQYGTQKHILHLENVNYIPLNRWNIFALGR
jgi:hypothetical protein